MDAISIAQSLLKVEEGDVRRPHATVHIRQALCPFLSEFRSLCKKSLGVSSSLRYSIYVESLIKISEEQSLTQCTKQQE
jgi:hypothetical protein